MCKGEKKNAFFECHGEECMVITKSRNTIFEWLGIVLELIRYSHLSMLGYISRTWSGHAQIMKNIQNDDTKA